MITFSIRTLGLKRARRQEPDQIAEVQSRRLRNLIRTAVQRSPFYREKFRGLDVDRCRLADLPTSNKAELMACFDETLTDREIRRADLEAFLDDSANAMRLFRGRYVASHTSGSQGQPMLILQNRRSVELFFGVQMTRGNAEPVTPGAIMRTLLRRRRLAVVTLKRGFYPSAALFQHMPRAARGYVEVLWLSQTDLDLIDRLNAFRPQALTAYAGVLEMLALEAEAGRLDLAPDLRQVVNNSEALTDRACGRIEQAFGLHVMNNYATGECPFLSNGCPTDQGAHVNADWAILEVVDEHDRPLPPGTPGQKVLITNLANTLQPIIRYEVGDVVTMAAGPCGCGSRLPRIERIGGRTADVFTVGESSRRRRMTNIVFVHAFEYLREVREWQAIQTDPTQVLVRFEPIPGATIDLGRARRAIDHEFETYGFEDVRVDFQVVPRLEADPRTGKFKRMVSQLATPPPAGMSADFETSLPGFLPVPSPMS